MTVAAPAHELDILGLLPPTEKLDALARARGEEYRHNKPYPHICFDDFLAAPVVEQVLEAFPSPDSIPWKRFKNDQEIKLASEREADIPPAARNVLYALNSATFLHFLEELTGIPNLIADPQFIGGGLHQIVPGGKLGIHVDFNLHTNYRLDRRLNLLLYLNKDWPESYGGQFEVWDREGKASVKRFAPIFNRCCIFSTSEISYHGNPNPVACPPGNTRKSLALYYYTNGRPEEEKAAEHTTRFIGAPADEPLWRRALRTGKTVARELLPPVVYRLRGKK